jgi:hypothetical protein
MYVAQYWLVIRQGAWHSTGMLLSKVMWPNINLFLNKFTVNIDAYTFIH